LLEKLGVKPDQRVCVLGVADAFAHDVAVAANRAPSSSLRGNFDPISCAIENEAELVRIERFKEHLVPNGALWAVAPKGKGSPVRESQLRAALLTRRHEGRVVLCDSDRVKGGHSGREKSGSSGYLTTTVPCTNA
jgi:hypothetical protein